MPTAVSTDLIHWRRVPDALPALPSWALVVRPPPFWSAPAGVSTLTWGPTVHQVAGGWVLYYSTDDAGTRRECLGAAFSTSPVGPFTDTSSAPLVCQAALGGDIDPSVVVPAPGHLALVWKNDGNANGTAVSIWEQSLTPDGRSTTGRPARLIGADQAWEHHIIEGPAMLADTKGGWWLFYSGGTWQSDTYDTGVAWCATVAGPCRRAGARSPAGQHPHRRLARRARHLRRPPRPAVGLLLGLSQPTGRMLAVAMAHPSRLMPRAVALDGPAAALSGHLFREHSLFGLLFRDTGARGVGAWVGSVGRLGHGGLAAWSRPPRRAHMGPNAAVVRRSPRILRRVPGGRRLSQNGHVGRLL